jgi:hypothetical protein
MYNFLFFQYALEQHRLIIHLQLFPSFSLGHANDWSRKIATTSPSIYIEKKQDTFVIFHIIRNDKKII